MMVERKEREIREFEFDPDYKDTIQSYTKISPDELIRLANILKQKNISSLVIQENYGSVHIQYYVLESEEEAEIREIKDRENNEFKIASHKRWLKDEAAKHGLKIVEE